MSHDYVRVVLSAYLALPDTPCRTSPFDRRLARDLFQRAVPLTTVTDAFSLAIARRRARPLDSPPLGSIRSIAYFLPLIDELLAQPLEPDYAAYLRRKVLNASAPPLA